MAVLGRNSVDPAKGWRFGVADEYRKRILSRRLRFDCDIGDLEPVGGPSDELFGTAVLLATGRPRPPGTPMG